MDAEYERTHGRLQQPDRAHAGPLDVALAGAGRRSSRGRAVIVLVGRSVLAALRRGSGWIVGISVGLIAHIVGQLLLFPVVELEPLVWLLAGFVLGDPAAARDRRARAAARARSGWPSSLPPRSSPGSPTSSPIDEPAPRSRRSSAGDHRGGRRPAEDAVDLRPDIVRLHVLAATARVADGQGLLAGIAELDAALDVSPGDPIVLLRRAGLLVDRAEATPVPDHLAVAAAEVDRRLADDPNNAALWRLAARVAEPPAGRACCSSRPPTAPTP